jgi:hypothetical protein
VYDRSSSKSNYTLQGIQIIEENQSISINYDTSFLLKNQKKITLDTPYDRLLAMKKKRNRKKKCIENIV